MTYSHSVRLVRKYCLVIVALACTYFTVWAAAAPIDPQLRDDLHEALVKASPRDEERLDKDKRLPFSLVIRGGISLGVYESGVNWALLRLLKDLRDNSGEAGTVRPEMLAAAGASAGAINGFLAGLMWCSDELRNGDKYIDTLDTNLLRHTWRSIDINGLLEYPEATETEDNEDKAAFTREALRTIQDDVKEAIHNRKFISGCDVAFGMSLTRSKPALASNAGVHVPQQRLVLPLQIESNPEDGGDIQVRNLAFPRPDFATEDHEKLSNRRFLASLIYLDGNVDERVTEANLEIDDVFDAIKASASFPVAFAPIKLSYCLYQPAPLRDQRVDVQLEDRLKTPDDRCPEDYRRLSSYFVDGGVFDNDPLGLVRKLSEKQVEELKLGDATVRYIKIDPDRRRPPTDHFKFILPEYAEAGDSIEISLWAGNYTNTNCNDTNEKCGTGFSPDEIDIETVEIRHCRSPKPSAGEKREWRKEGDEYEVMLTETAKNSQLFVGAVHTRPKSKEQGGKEKGKYLTGVHLVVDENDRLLVYSSREKCKPTCATSSDEEKGDKEKCDEEKGDAYELELSKRRSIGIVSEVPPGLTTQLRFLGGSVTSARSYRLYDELMSTNWHDGAYEYNGNDEEDREDRQRIPDDSRPLFQPARLTPLVADFLFAFGAFLDVHFRDFDYYAGVYDAVYGMAEFLCFSASGSGENRDKCRGEQAQRIYLQLCAPTVMDPGDNPDERMLDCQTSSPESNAVIYQMVLLETCGVEAAAKASLDPDSESCPLQSHWQWAEELAKTTEVSKDEDEDRQKLLLIGAALLESNDEVSDSGQDPFVRFVRKLAKNPNGFAAEESKENRESKVLDDMLTRYDRPIPTWWYPIVDKAVPRLIDLQDQDKDVRESIGLEASEQAAAVKGTLALTGFAFESEFKEPTGWMWNQTSVPDHAKRRWIASIVPSEIAVDSRNGEAAFYWNPGWRFHEDMGVDFRFSPYVRQRTDETTIEFAELTALLTWRLENPLLSSLGIGPTTTYLWSREEVGKDINLGASVSMGLLADKLRIAYGWRSFSKDDFPGDPIYLQLAVNDLPGIAYWICRGLTRCGSLR